MRLAVGTDNLVCPAGLDRALVAVCGRAGEIGRSRLPRKCGSTSAQDQPNPSRRGRLGRARQKYPPLTALNRSTSRCAPGSLRGGRSVSWVANLATSGLALRSAAAGRCRSGRPPRHSAPAPPLHCTCQSRFADCRSGHHRSGASGTDDQDVYCECSECRGGHRICGFSGLDVAPDTVPGPARAYADSGARDQVWHPARGLPSSTTALRRASQSATPSSTAAIRIARRRLATPPPATMRHRPVVPAGGGGQLHRGGLGPDP